MMAQFDFVVIGSGSLGSAAGYYASKSGLNVLMLDEFTPPHTQGAHHGQTRIMRQAYGEGAHYVPMLIKAQSLWLELKTLWRSHSDQPIYEQTGVLTAGPKDTTFIQEAKLSAQQYELNAQVMTADEVKQKWPEFQLPSNYEALLEPDSGVLYSENIVEAYLAQSLKLGATHRFNCSVLSLDEVQGSIVINTSQGVFTAKKAVVTAGTWVKKIFPELPITPIRRVFAWHQADNRYSSLNHFPAFTVEDSQGDAFYGFPSQDNMLKLGKHIEWEPISERQQRVPFGSKPTDGGSLLKFLKNYLPGVGGCLQGAACTYDMSPDEHFIIDYWQGSCNLMVMTGLSGHGFKFASVLGLVASQFAAEQAIEFDLLPFSLSRFEPKI